MVKMHINKEENNYFKGIVKNMHFKKCKELYPLLLNTEFLETFSSESRCYPYYIVLLYQKKYKFKVFAVPHWIWTMMKEILELRRKLVYHIKGHKSVKADITA